MANNYRGSEMKAVEVENLFFNYLDKKEKILDGINVTIRKGEIIGLVGLSGSGKSTFCHCICGIIPKIYEGNLQGTIKIFGIDIENMKIAEIASKIGVIFQNPDTQLFSPNVEDELAFGPENLCIERDEIGHRIKKALELVGMEKYRYHNPNELSGGQKQLIAIASVLTMQPQILICDEIMSQIDQKGVELIKKALIEIKNQGKTIIMVEHNNSNLNIADRVLLLKDGKIEEIKTRNE